MIPLDAAFASLHNTLAATRSEVKQNEPCNVFVVCKRSPLKRGEEFITSRDVSVALRYVGI
jgi:hypothetical protein